MNALRMKARIHCVLSAEIGYSNRNKRLWLGDVSFREHKRVYFHCFGHETHRCIAQFQSMAILIRRIVRIVYSTEYQHRITGTIGAKGRKRWLKYKRATCVDVSSRRGSPMARGIVSIDCAQTRSNQFPLHCLSCQGIASGYVYLKVNTFILDIFIKSNNVLWSHICCIIAPLNGSLKENVFKIAHVDSVIECKEARSEIDHQGTEETAAFRFLRHFLFEATKEGYSWTHMVMERTKSLAAGDTEGLPVFGTLSLLHISAFLRDANDV